MVDALVHVLELADGVHASSLVLCLGWLVYSQVAVLEFLDDFFQIIREMDSLADPHIVYQIFDSLWHLLLLNFLHNLHRSVAISIGVHLQQLLHQLVYYFFNGKHQECILTKELPGEVFKLATLHLVVDSKESQLVAICWVIQHR